MTNIFDLNDLGGVSSIAQSALNLSVNITEIEKNILLLFDQKEILSINELVVAYDRKFNISSLRVSDDKIRVKITSVLSRLGKKGFLVRVEGKKGVYQKCEGGLK